MAAWLIVTGAVGMIAGCAAAPRGPEDNPTHHEHREPAAGERLVLGGGDSPTPRSAGLNVFISPMGEPFRADRGEPYPVVRWFDRVNASRTGEVTEAEFVTDADGFFNALDTNHDGTIDGFELNDYERNVAPEIQPHIRGLRAGEGMDPDLRFDEREGQPSPRGRGRAGLGRDGGAAQGREMAGDLARQGAAIFGLLPDPEPVASASAELNGRITRAEWREAARRRFQRLLPDGRTTLTLQTLPKTPVQILLEQRRARRVP
jgi:hypothetical protein